jgi:N-methylhydantoinase A
MLWIGIDVGGTFTDAVAYDEAAGTFAFAKAPSTPADPTCAVLEVLSAMQLDLGAIERLVHGVTIGTNAVLEGKGAEVWMLVTKGFRDVLEIGRTNRPVLYDIRTQKAPPLVPRTRAIEVDERLLFDGSALRAIDATEVEKLAARIPERRDIAIAICFLHSYANPEHELTAKAVVAAVRPGQFVCTSSEVLPQFREYERFNTTALNAYIGPLMDSYLTRLEAGLRDRGFRRDLHIMTSAGGVATAARARRLPISTVLSGPAAGVAAAVHLGSELGFANIITCDMGGTSTDVCLIEALKVPVTGEQKISHYANRTPQIEINSVGAGGGSIAWVDAGDTLMVGPQSAGATPGPACYGRGGTQVTVTDANLALNRLSAGSPLGSGHIPLDRTLALEALEGLGRRVGLEAVSLADGIVRIAVARMVSAIKQISIANGHDPREFVLLPYGGAGPMHAAAIADELEIGRILVPVGPGNFAAFGSLISDIRLDYARTRTMQLDDRAEEEIAAIFSNMEQEARDNLRSEGVAEAQVEINRALGMRYLGQSWELVVDLPGAADNTGASAASGKAIAPVERILAAFADVHDRRFGHRSGGAVEIVSFRLAAVGRVAKPRLPLLSPTAPRSDARSAMRDVHFGTRFHACAVYARDRLVLDEVVVGPAVIEESGSTTIVPPGWTARTMAHGELLMERSGHG